MDKTNSLPATNETSQLISSIGDYFEKIMTKVVRREFGELKDLIKVPPPSQYEYLTRNQTADRLNITLPTLGTWTKTGILKGYKIKGRVLYKAEEIDQALREQLKYVRK